MSFVSRQRSPSGDETAAVPGDAGAGTGPAAFAVVPAVNFRGVDLWVHGREGRVDLLRGVTWAVGAGEHWAVLGANGAGKSSLLSVCGAVRHPSRGTADVLGARLGRVDLRALRERIGVVDAVTAARVPASLTVGDVALTGAAGTVLPRPEVYTAADRDRAAGELERVGLKALQDRGFDDCSAGERQRALLARALVGEPDLLLLDEAAVGLDLPAREALLAALVLAAQARPDRATITVTHHVEELPPTTSHALLLRDARVLAAGPVTDVLTSEAVSACFGLPVSVGRVGERWVAQAAGSWQP